MTMQKSRVILTTSKNFLEPSLLKCLENDISYGLAHPGDSKEKRLLTRKIGALKEHLHSAVIWSIRADKGKLAQLYGAMQEQNFTSIELNNEGHDSAYLGELHRRHHRAYDACEILTKSILENHDLADSHFLTIQIAAQLNHSPEYKTEILGRIEKEALNANSSKKILKEIRRNL
ncbi:MAG: hypothetical protein KGH53_03130 [Candidatus Micrarchaeota archaeon]|nr:hypothetical protein [Candidatus Micrarchaeota archaeon]